MLSHGHARTDLRHLHLHRVALEKLRIHPELRDACRTLVEQWLEEKDQEPSRRWLEQWRVMLSEWPIEQITETVLDWEGGQVLRQCSPLAPALTPQERWAALDEAERVIEREVSAGPQ